jgi:hypothetical protein
MRWVFYEAAQIDESSVNSELCMILIAREAVLSVILYYYILRRLQFLVEYLKTTHSRPKRYHSFQYNETYVMHFSCNFIEN